MPNFALNNAGPGDVVLARGEPGRRYRVKTFAFTFPDGNGCFFRDRLGGNAVSPLFQAQKGSVLTPENTGGYKNFLAGVGAPLVLAITGTGTITGEIVYELLPPGQ